MELTVIGALVLILGTIIIGVVVSVIAAVGARRHAKRDAELLRRSANGLIYPVPGRKR